MAKSKQAAEKMKKIHKPIQKDLLKVSKAIKIMATYAGLAGFSKRQTILLMGDAERTFRENGYLVMD